MALAFAIGFQGRQTAALQSLDHAATIAREQGRTMDLIEVLHAIINCEVSSGTRWADETLDELVRLGAATTNGRATAIVKASLGLTALLDGRPEAATLLRDAADLAADRMTLVEATWAGWAHLADAGQSAKGQLLGLAGTLHHYERTRLPLALRWNLRTFAPALSRFDRHTAVAVVKGAGPASGIFPRESEQAFRHARNVLGAAEYERLVEWGHQMSTDQVAAFLRGELDLLAIRT